MIGKVRQRFRDWVHGTSPERRRLILALLATEPQYGFQILGAWEGTLDYSTLYAELHRLHKDGYITAPSPGFRYTITDAGRALLEASEGEGTVGK